MKYTCSIDIDKPIDQVAKLWADENSFSEWQDGFKSIELLEGTHGAEGAKSRILFEQGKRSMGLIETIITNNLPDEKKALYEHVDMVNTQTTRFEKLNENQTRYISEVVYTDFNGFIPNLMAKLFPSVYRKQSEKWMKQFKEFVERMD